MDPLLALIRDLYGQIIQQAERIAALEAELANRPPA